MSYHIGYKCNWITLYDDKKSLTTVRSRACPKMSVNKNPMVAN